MNASCASPATAAERDATIARVIVDIVGRVRDGEVGAVYGQLRELPAELHDAVLAEARARTGLDRVEREALRLGGRP